MIGYIIDELDYMISFGYRNDLLNLQFHFQKMLEKSLLIITQMYENEELKDFRQKLGINQLEEFI